MKNIAVFVSGGGSNFGAVLEGIEKGQIDAKVCVVIASKAGIFAIERAKAHGIPYYVFPRADFLNTDLMFQQINSVLVSFAIDYIVLAGYLTVLPKSFVQKYPRKIVNIHPSLIPKFCGDGFYGIKVHQAVLAAHETKSGATVHFVDEGTDTGDIILQREVPVLAGDTPETLAARVLETEHKIIVEAVSRICKK